MADISRLSRLLAGMQRQVALNENTLLVDNLKIKMGSGDDANHATFSGSLTAPRTISMPDADVNLADIALNTTHRSSDGSDHSIVVSNQTHASGDGSDHADVAANTTHSTGDGTDHSAVSGHLDGGASKHDASEVDVEAADGVNHSQADLETVVGELDDAISSNTSAASAAQADATQALADAAAAQGDIDSHTDGSANKHDASEVDYERADGSKKDIGAGSDDVEAALSDLDDKKISSAGLIAFTADQSMGGFKLTNLGAPASASDAARLSDVQAAQAGQLPKAPVDLVSTSNITLSGEQTIDGTLTSASRVLVAGQTDATENGIYVSAAGAWSRAADADGNPDGEIAQGNTALVLGGTSNANTVYILNATDAADPADITPDTEEQGWIIYSRAESTTASGGIQKVGLDFSLAASVAGTGIDLSGGVLSIDFTEFDSDSIVEGSTNLFFTEARVLATQLSGHVAAAGTVADGDSIHVALEKLDGNANAAQSDATQALADAAAAQSTADNHIADASGAHAASAISYSGSDLSGSEVDAALDDAGSRIASLESSVAKVESLEETVVAGEAFTAAGGPYVVRWGVSDLDTPETAGRVYKADPTELSLVKTGGNKDPFWAVGIAAPGSDVSVAGDIDITRAGPITITSHGFAVGEPIYLASSGALTNTAPTANGEAQVIVGFAKDANVIDVKISYQGVN